MADLRIPPARSTLTAKGSRQSSLRVWFRTPMRLPPALQTCEREDGPTCRSQSPEEPNVDAPGASPSLLRRICRRLSRTDLHSRWKTARLAPQTRLRPCAAALRAPTDPRAQAPEDARRPTRLAWCRRRLRLLRAPRRRNRGDRWIGSWAYPPAPKSNKTHALSLQIHVAAFTCLNHCLNPNHKTTYCITTSHGRHRSEGECATVAACERRGAVPFSPRLCASA